MNKHILSSFLILNLILNGSAFAQIGDSSLMLQDQIRENQMKENRVSATYSGANVEYNHQENDEQSNKNNGMPAYPNIPTGAQKMKVAL